MFVEQVKFSACIRVQHTKYPSSERVTGHGVVPNCFFGFKVVLRSRPSSLDVTDRQSRSRCRGVGGNQRHKTWQTWQGRERVCASLLLPGCHANGREEMRILVFGRKQQGLQNYLRFTQTPLLLPRQPSKSIRDWPSYPGTDALPPLILFLKKIRSWFLA
jgi:hypothetical protein